MYIQVPADLCVWLSADSLQPRDGECDNPTSQSVTFLRVDLANTDAIYHAGQLRQFSERDFSDNCHEQFAELYCNQFNAGFEEYGRSEPGWRAHRLDHHILRACVSVNRPSTTLGSTRIAATHLHCYRPVLIAACVVLAGT
jgi:hypothetical protein